MELNWGGKSSWLLTPDGAQSWAGLLSLPWRVGGWVGDQIKKAGVGGSQSRAHTGPLLLPYFYLFILNPCKILKTLGRV